MNTFPKKNSLDSCAKLKYAKEIHARKKERTGSCKAMKKLMFGISYAGKSQ